MNDIERLFREVDRLWGSARSKKIPLKVIGSGALFLQTTYSRSTKDGDVLETLEVTAELKKRLLALAGKNTLVHEQTGLYLDVVINGLPFLPHGPSFHPQARINAGLRHFSIEALDVTDVVVSKLKRFNKYDAEDVRAMADRGLIAHDKLIDRFNAAVDRFSMDSRADDLPRIIANLNRVERDMLRVKESKIDLPDWMG
jgi:hypothetical protein